MSPDNKSDKNDKNDTSDTNDTEDTADAAAAEDAATEDAATEVTDSPDDEATPEETTDAAVAPRGRSVRTKVVAGLLAAALIASAGLAGWLYVYQYRPGQATSPAAADVALDAAKSGTTALLSYSPESLDQDFAAAKGRLTGDFLAYYTQFTEQIVEPAAREKSVKTAATVVRAAVSKLEPNSAEVLVFVNQTTTSQDNPDGAFAASSVNVGLTKVDGAWLIESFDPV